MTRPDILRARAIHFGVDIGGTGIKGAPVDLATGSADRRPRAHRHPAAGHPRGVGRWSLRSSTTSAGPARSAPPFPAAIKNGIAMTAANVDKSWIGTDIEASLAAATGTEVRAVNDADAAGRRRDGLRRGQRPEGVVIMATLGTGIGTALFLHGQLVPNTELGHLEIDGKDAEKEALRSSSARRRA